MVILFDQFNLPDSIYEIIFATSQQVMVAKLLVEQMKLKEGEIGKTEMSMFATALHDGTILEAESESQFVGKTKVKLSYNKRQFYDRILTPMKTMGLIDYDLYKKTYKLSEKFNKNMMRIGLTWLQELRKPPRPFVLKTKWTKNNNHELPTASSLTTLPSILLGAQNPFFNWR